MGITPTIKAKPIFPLFFLLFQFGLAAANTLIPGQTLSGNKTLISPGEIFALGFFSPGSSQNFYLGIWYNKISVFTVVWVANRENPITNSTNGVLKIATDGNLVVLDGRNITLWSTNSSLPSNSKSSAKVLDSGNLVLMESSSGRILWQSFDYPSDTNLPGMKLGINLKTGHVRSLTSWKHSDDPSPGNFSFKMDIRGSPQFFIFNGVNPYWRSGPWNGKRLSGVPEMNPNYIFNISFIKNQDEIYFTYLIYNNSIISRMLLDRSGSVQRLTWHERNQRWVSFWSAPGDPCQVYGACGPFARCTSENSTLCTCLQGFEPKSPQNWYFRDWSDGCVRRTEIKCGKRDGFLRLIRMELPDTSLAQIDERLSLQECETKCLNNCSCNAYANSNINGGGSGCVIWHGDLMDLREYSNGGQELYLRLDSSELGDRGNGQSKGSNPKRKILMIAAATTILGMLLFVWYYFFMFKRKKKIKGSRDFSFGNMLEENQGGKKCSEIPLFNFGIIQAATRNFSDTNKLGEGGFGLVYKGILPSRQEIAVKKLSKDSGQGIDEFENEIILTAKLQHRNLVRLLGYCIQGEEKMLIYEYMPNTSLDSFLFDQTKSSLLDWNKRFHIIIGIARGLLYLHQDSVLRIIHRDLKPSNILLDDEMNPKISDFGMARIFGGNQIQENTNKVIGTPGYMSPEYAMGGVFSVKSDVFSFGVLVLEIVSGKKRNCFDHFNESLSLLGYGWKLWKEGKSLELRDPSIIDSCCKHEVLRCIQIGLLCVQDYAGDRPDMSSIVFMLGSEETNLPSPKQPIFSMGITLPKTSTSKFNSCSRNNVTITMVEAR